MGLVMASLRSLAGESNKIGTSATSSRALPARRHMAAQSEAPMTWFKYFDTLAAILGIGCLIGLAAAVLFIRCEPCGNCADLPERGFAQLTQGFRSLSCA